MSQTDTVAEWACDAVVTCDVAGGKRPLHVGMGPGHIEGHVERGWTCGKGLKRVSMCRYASKCIQTVVGDLGKALVAGGAMASAEVGRGEPSVVEPSRATATLGCGVACCRLDKWSVHAQAMSI